MYIHMQYTIQVSIGIVEEQNLSNILKRLLHIHYKNYEIDIYL